MPTRLFSPAVNLITPVNWRCPLTADLIGWWLVMPGTMGGSMWRDITKNDLDGELRSGHNPATDWVGVNRPGGWGALDGQQRTDDYVQKVPVRNNALDTTDVTVCAWVNAHSLSGFTRVWSCGTTGARNQYSLMFNAARLLFQINNTGHNSPADGSITVDEWWHVAFVFDDSANNIKFYFNGDLDPTQPTTTEVIGTGIPGFVIGCASPNNEGTQQFDGFIDDVRVYRRTLSGAEMKALYDDSRTGHRQTLNWIDHRGIMEAGIPAVGGLSIPVAMANYRRRHEMRI